VGRNREESVAGGAERQRADRDRRGVAINPRGGERLPHRHDGAAHEVITRRDLDPRERATAGDAMARALEEEPVRRVVDGQEVERRTQRAA